MTGAFLPVTEAVRDRANAYLAGMAARGFVPPAMREVVRQAEAAHRVDCGNCYGNGCSSCGGKGAVETPAGREAREEWEDGAYDRARDDRLTERGL